MYDEKIAVQIREIMSELPDVTEKKMFGGLTFMLNGNMCCGVDEEKIMVRVGPEKYDEVLSMEYAEPFDITGRPLKGLVFISPQGFQSNESLKKWINMGISFAGSLTKKKSK